FADTVLPKFPSSEKHKVVPADLAAMGSGSSLVGIKEGETYTVHDLWLGVFLRSGNDAVHVLSAMNDGLDNTVKEMNQHAGELQNTNRLLAGDSDVSVYQGIAGVKNGNTTNAGATFTGVAERNGRVLLVTVMHPEKNEHNEVYKETAKLFDWGFQAVGKARS